MTSIPCNATVFETILILKTTELAKQEEKKGRIEF